jgi:hypothetical protein
MLNQLIWDAELGIGPINNALPVQTSGFSTPKEPVFQFLTYVKLMMLQELVLPVLLDMIWLTEFVFSHLPITLNHLIWDVPLGIGPTKNVSVAHITGFSTLKEFVFQFQTYVNLMMLQELALPAILDMI